MTYIDRPRSNAQEASPKIISGPTVVTTFAQRDAWSRKIARDRRLKLTYRHVLRSLALCTRVDGDGKLVIDPTYVEIARAAGCCKRVAQYAVAAAEDVGIIRKARHSDGRVSNAFELVPNGVKNAAKAPEKTQLIQCPTVHGFATSEGSNGASACTVLRVKSKEEESKKESKIERPKRPQAAFVESQHLASNGNKPASDAALNLALETCISDITSAPEGRLCSASVEVEEPTETQPLAASCYPIPVYVTNRANGATPELPAKAFEAHRNGGIGPYVRQTGSAAITLPAREIPTKNGAYRAIDLAGQAARGPETEPHHKGHSTMSSRIQSREEMFAKIKRVYPPKFLGNDDALSFEALGIALDHGTEFTELMYEASQVPIEPIDGVEVPLLVEFLASKCWTEAIAA